jgi:membrane-associated phospholipid phosphatase
MKAAAKLQRTHRMEVRGELALAGVRKHPAVRIASALAQIADQPPLMAASASVLVVTLLRGDKRLAEASARVLTAVAVTTALKSQVEGAVRRTRPNAVLDGKPYRMRRGGAKAGAERSFPSGHTADAFAAARALARVYPEQSALLWSAAALIALIQLPAGAHYPSDIAAGAVIGIAGEGAANTLVNSLVGGLGTSAA